MLLYIHFGIYKTGSSYLQHLCARNRDVLKAGGFFYPTSPFEKEMVKGIISPGNARNLVGLLNSKDQKGCADLISEWKLVAEKNGCDKILISAEALVHAFALGHGIPTLESAASIAGITGIHALGYFRDLADHAISTYRHRAKSGKIKDFEHWLQNTYEAPRVLREFFRNINQQSSTTWTFRKFRKDSGFLRDSFFKDWLGVHASFHEQREKVNESLTFSEIMVMKEVSAHYRQVTDFFIDAFKEMPAQYKASDKDLEQYHFSLACKHLQQYDALIAEINARFPEMEKLAIGTAPTAPQAMSAAQLSAAQLEVLFTTIEKFNKPVGKLIAFRRNIRKMVPERILQKLLKLKSSANIWL